jgi:hypothetical protein
LLLLPSFRDGPKDQARKFELVLRFLTLSRSSQMCDCTSGFALARAPE